MADKFLEIMLKLFSICLLVCSLSQFQLVQSDGQITDGGKLGFYIVTTFTNNISLTTFDLKSEFLFNISQVGPFVDTTFRGTLVNLRNDNKTGELVGILYASQETMHNFNIQNISATYLKDKTFSNKFIYYLYFTVIDFRINSVLFDPDYMDSSHWKTIYIKSVLKANINQTLTNLGLTMFDPGVPSLNEFSIRLSNESGKLRTTMFFNFFSNVYIINLKENSGLIQNIARSYNWTLFNSFWDIISTYSSKGDKIYEFYVTGSMNVPSYMIQGYQPEALANYINSVYFNIINLLLPYGVFYQAEVLNINYATGVVDFHGSMLTRSPLLSDLSNIVSMMSPWTSLYNLFNLVIYNIYKANIFISVNEDVISTYSSLNRSYIENIQYYIMSRLMQSNLILMDKNYFNFGLESLISENRNGILSYFLVSSTNDNLFEVQRHIQNIFLSLPSTVDPFNTNIERYHRYLTDTNYLTTTTTSSTITTTSIPIITSSTIQTSSSLSSNIKSTTATLSSTTPTILPTTTITSSTTSTPSSSSSTLTTTTTTSTSPTTLSPSTTGLSSPTPSSTTSLTTPTRSSSSSTSTTSTTPTTLSTTTITTTVSITKNTDTITKVDMKCSFNETYKKEYGDTNSVEYQSYTKSIYNKLVAAFVNTILRILAIKFNSIIEGSVVVDMEITTASATPVNSDSVTQIVKENAPKAFDSSMTILNINSTVLYIPTSTTPGSTYLDSNFPPWGIALIIVCVTVIIVVAIILIYTGRRYSHLSQKEV